MPKPRIIGLENEYGILNQANPEATSATNSAAVIEAYRTSFGGVRWDYSGESPLHDARGFTVAREDADPSMLTDDPDSLAPSGPVRKVQATEVVRLMPWELKFQKGHNIAMPNGGRLYLDHSHPEYATPEVTSPTAALAYDQAGDALLAQVCPEDIRLFKNNTDGKGATYGTHENYQLDRSVSFADLAAATLPYLVCRQILVGSGRVGIGIESENTGYQISQRADFFEDVMSLRTTWNRPIINTRDEPHADPEKYRRYHVISGDANRFTTPNFLKLAMTCLILDVLESEGVAAFAGLEIVDPVSEIKRVSHDLVGSHRIVLADGRKLTAAEIMREYYQICVVKSDSGNPETVKALEIWDRLSSALLQEANNEDERLVQLSPFASELEWVSKWQLLSAYASRQNLDWDSATLHALDLQWAEITGKGGLAKAVGIVNSFTTPEQIEHAISSPPANTRAWLRGTLIKRFPVEAAGWHSILIDADREYLQRLPLTEATEWTREQVGEIIDKCETLADVFHALAKPPKAHPGATFGNLWY